MRFLMVCMQYPTGPGQSYMTTELADALVAAGHGVEVLHLDWSGPADGPTEIGRQVPLFWATPPILSRALPGNAL